jgi:hypothetical protein
VIGDASLGRTFVRVGPTGQAYGPFLCRFQAEVWLLSEGFALESENATFKVYEAKPPEQYAKDAQFLDELEELCEQIEADLRSLA